MKLTVRTATTLALMLLPAYAMAADSAVKPEHTPGKRWEKTDANKDGKLSKDEYTAEIQARSEKRFKEIDANSDGFITREEMKAYHDKNPRRGRMTHEKAEDAKPE